MSIINDALKKVQSSLENKDAAVPLAEQTPVQAPPEQQPKTELPIIVPPPPKTLTIIELEQKKKKLELERQEELLAQKRSSPLPKLLKISFFIFLFACSILASLYFSGYLKKHSSLPKFPQISTLTKSFNEKITSLQHGSSPSKPGSSNSTPLLETISFQPSSWVSNEKTSSAKKTSPKNFVLRGIITKNNHQAALINDEIYEEGSMIGETKVVSISFQEVKLLDGDQTITLRIEGARR